MQINNKMFVDTTLRNIGEGWKELEIPIFSEIEKMNHISDSVVDIIQNKWKSIESLQQIQNNFGRLNF